MNTTPFVSIALLLPVAASAAAAGEADLPSPPAIFARVGDTVLTTLERSREVDARLAPYTDARRRIVAAGKWNEEQEENFAKLKQNLTMSITRRMLRDALIEELARAAGIRADEVLIEMRIKSAAKRLGGIDKLAKAERRSLAEIRSQLEKADVTRRFYRVFVPQGVPPTPAEIRAYYDDNIERMRSPNRVGLSILTIPYGSDRAAAFERIESLRRELQFAPDRFAARARANSSHESAGRGGIFTMMVKGVETHMIPADMLPKSWLAAIARLQPGRVSPTIPGAENYALLKLDKIEEGSELSFADAADKIAALLSRQLEQKIVADWSDYYLGKAYVVGVDVKDLRAADEPE